MNIYVGNLPYSVKSRELRETFENYGDVSSAEVIFDRRTKRSRGYGFVEMENDQDGERAIDALNGADYKGRELRVDRSQPKEEKSYDRQDRRADGGRERATPETNGGGVFGFVKKLFG